MTNKLLYTFIAALIAANIFAQEWISSPENGEGRPMFTKTFKAEKCMKAATIHTKWSIKPSLADKEETRTKVILR